MTSGQKWAVIVFSFILALVIVVGSYSFTSLKSIERILSSPAATSKIDIDADMSFEMSQDGQLQLQYIHLNRMQGEFNSKILDLILLIATAD